jgi:DNA invertase Pin-like site-specific DNA recombinase
MKKWKEGGKKQETRPNYFTHETWGHSDWLRSIPSEQKPYRNHDYHGYLPEKGMNIHTTKERHRFDDTINSKILCFAFGLVAEIERNLISLRTKEALALRPSEGKTLGRPVGSAPKLQILIDNEGSILHMLDTGTSIRAI